MTPEEAYWAGLGPEEDEPEYAAVMRQACADRFTKECSDLSAAGWVEISHPLYPGSCWWEHSDYAHRSFSHSAAVHQMRWDGEREGFRPVPSELVTPALAEACAKWSDQHRDRHEYPCACDTNDDRIDDLADYFARLEIDDEENGLLARARRIGAAADALAAILKEGEG